MSPSVSLAYSAQQRAYADSVHAFFARESGAVSMVEADQPPSSGALAGSWAKLTDALSAVALPLPEPHGVGGSWQDVGIVLEAAGRAASPLPYLSAVTSVRLLETAATSDAAAELAQAAAGTRLNLAVPASTFWGAGAASAGTWHDGRVDVRVSAVLDAPYADSFVVPVRAGGAFALAVVPASGVQVSLRRGLDLRRSFGDVVIAAAPGRLLDCADPERALREALIFAAIGVAADAIGGAQHCLDTTVAYVSTRTQFRKVVGSFQAVKHTLADVVCALEPARAATRDALEAVCTDDPDLPRLAAVARLSAVEAYAQTAGAAIQLHGAIGFTWELGLHHYFKRAVTSRALFGSAGEHRDVLRTYLLAELSASRGAGSNAGNDGAAA